MEATALVFLKYTCMAITDTNTKDPLGLKL